MSNEKLWDNFPRCERRFESVSIATPAIRTVIVYAHHEGLDSDPEPDIEVGVIPVLAIQASIVRDLIEPDLDHDRNHAKAVGWKEIDCDVEHDFVIMHPMMYSSPGTAAKIMAWMGASWTVVVCPWSPELDDLKLADIKKDLIESAKIRKYQANLPKSDL